MTGKVGITIIRTQPSATSPAAITTASRFRRTRSMSAPAGVWARTVPTSIAAIAIPTRDGSQCCFERDRSPGTAPGRRGRRRGRSSAHRSPRGCAATGSVRIRALTSSRPYSLMRADLHGFRRVRNADLRSSASSKRSAQGTLHEEVREPGSPVEYASRIPTQGPSAPLGPLRAERGATTMPGCTSQVMPRQGDSEIPRSAGRSGGNRDFVATKPGESFATPTTRPPAPGTVPPLLGGFRTGNEAVRTIGGFNRRPVSAPLHPPPDSGLDPLAVTVEA